MIIFFGTALLIILASIAFEDKHNNKGKSGSSNT
jgi:hypothetical protein